MTEQEWLACADPALMLAFLQGWASARKLRLFACACCRRIGGRIEGSGLRGVEVAERYADRLATAKELAAARPSRGTAALDAAHFACARTAQVSTCGQTASYALTAEWFARANWRAGVVRTHKAQAAMLHDIFGNPFSPVSLAPAWMTPAVLNLAQAAYDNRVLPSGLLDNTQLAVLADALEEAGCTNQEILSHLRGPGPHVRGCWPVDLILGKG